MHQYTEDRLVSMNMPLYSWPSLASLKVGLLANMVFPPEDQQIQSPRPLETLRSLEVKSDYGLWLHINIQFASTSRLLYCCRRIGYLKLLQHCALATGGAPVLGSPSISAHFTLHQPRAGGLGGFIIRGKPSSAPA